MEAPVHSATLRRSTARASATASKSRGVLRDDVEPVLGRVAGEDDGGEDHRHVFAGLAGQVAAVAARSVPRSRPAPERFIARCTRPGPPL